MQHHHADMHHVWYCCVLLKTRLLSYLQPCHLARQEGAQHFQIPLSTKCCPASSVICEKVQSKLNWTKILHHTTTFSCAMVFYEVTWIDSRQISAILPQSWQLASSFIIRWSMKVPPTTFNSSTYWQNVTWAFVSLVRSESLHNYELVWMYLQTCVQYVLYCSSRGVHCLHQLPC